MLMIQQLCCGINKTKQGELDDCEEMKLLVTTHGVCIQTNTHTHIYI